MFVFGEVQDPNPETVNLVEDIVRGQIVELVCVFVGYIEMTTDLVTCCSLYKRARNPSSGERVT